MFGWLKNLFLGVTRRAARPARLPDVRWRAALKRVPMVAYLGAEELDRLRDLVAVFLRDKHLEGAGRLELTDEMRLVIAIQACLPILTAGGIFSAFAVDLLSSTDFTMRITAYTSYTDPASPYFATTSGSTGGVTVPASATHEQSLLACHHRIATGRLRARSAAPGPRLATVDGRKHLATSSMSLSSRGRGHGFHPRQPSSFAPPARRPSRSRGRYCRPGSSA